MGSAIPSSLSSCDGAIGVKRSLGLSVSGIQKSLAATGCPTVCYRRACR